MRARENPFAMVRLERIAFRFESGDLDDLLRRLSQLGYRAAIVGPEGSGKTTLLEALAAQLAGQGWNLRPLRLRRDQPCPGGVIEQLLKSSDPRTLILLDGAEQLGWWRWRRLVRGARAAGGLVITTHRAGRLPTLIACRTSIPLLSGIVDELLDAAPLADARRAELRAAAVTLYAQHGGNPREVLRGLYDWCAEAPGQPRRVHLPPVAAGPHRAGAARPPCDVAGCLLDSP